jgi:hypothetical protein
MEIIKTKGLSYDYIESDENDKVVSVLLLLPARCGSYATG